MQTLLWTFIRWGVLESGAVLALLYLTGFHICERLAARTCNVSLKLGDGKSAVRVRLPMIMLTIGVMACLSETLSLTNLRHNRSIMNETGNLAGLEELKSRVLRHQRNWWLSLLCVVEWVILWRWSGIVKGLRDQLAALKGRQS